MVKRVAEKPLSVGWAENSWVDVPCVLSAAAPRVLSPPESLLCTPERVRMKKAKCLSVIVETVQAS